jgi:hypothetical protein
VFQLNRPYIGRFVSKNMENVCPVSRIGLKCRCQNTDFVVGAAKGLQVDCARAETQEAEGIRFAATINELAH